MTKNKQEAITRLAFSNVRSRIPSETLQELESSKRQDVRDDARYVVATSIYINTLSFAVTVVEPSGKRFQVLPRKHRKYKDVFVIRKNLKLDFQEHRDMVNWMVEKADEADDRLSKSKSLKDTIELENPEKYFSLYHLAKEFGQKSKPATGWANTSIWNDFYEDYVVASSKDFEDRILNGERVWAGEIYHTPTAMLISSHSLRNAGLNPNEPLYSNQERIEVMEEEGRIKYQDVASRFELISTDHNYIPKFVMIGGKVEKLLPKKDNTGKRQDGIYYTYLTRDGLGSNHFVPTVEYCGMEEAAERYGIYNTYEEAWNHGYRDKKILSKVDELEQKVNFLTQERDTLRARTESDKTITDNKLANLQQKYDVIKSQKEESNRNLIFLQSELTNERERQTRIEADRRQERDAEIERYKRETERQKDEFDRQKMAHEAENNERKQKTEVIKFVSGAIITVLGVIGAIFTFMAKKKA